MEPSENSMFTAFKKKTLRVLKLFGSGITSHLEKEGGYQVWVKDLTTSLDSMTYDEKWVYLGIKINECVGALTSVHQSDPIYPYLLVVNRNLTALRNSTFLAATNAPDSHEAYEELIQKMRWDVDLDLEN